MSKESLLNRAKKIPGTRSRNYGFGKEQVELAVAYYNDEITYKQVKTIMELKGSNVYNFLATVLKYGIQNGLVEVKNK